MMDKLADPAHPLWKFLRVAVVLVVILFVFQFAYQHGLGIVDIIPIITILATIAGFDVTKATITNLLKSQ
jgi:hypothetical protein